MNRFTSLAIVVFCLFSNQENALALDAAWEKDIAAGKKALQLKHFADAHKYINAAVATADACPNESWRNYELQGALEESMKAYDAQKLFSQGDIAEAQSLVLSEHSNGPNSIMHASKLECDAHRFLRHGQFLDAERLYRKSLSVRDKLSHPSIDLGFTLAGLASSLQGQHKFEEAEKLFKRCLAINYPSYKYLDFRLENLAKCYIAQGRFKEAKPLLKQASEFRAEVKALTYAENLCVKAAQKRASGKLSEAEAEKEFKKAINIQEKVRHPSISKVNILRSYSAYLKSIGKDSEAEEFKDKSDKISTDLENEKTDSAQRELSF